MTRALRDPSLASPSLHPGLSIVIALAAAVVVAAPVPAQSYGTNPQVFAIGAAGFRPASSTATFAFDGNEYVSSPFMNMLAALDLPEGAEIRGICIYGNVSTKGALVSAAVHGVKLAPGGTTGGVKSFPETFVLDDIPIGFGTVCTEPFSLTLRQITDLDGDGNLDNVAYSLSIGVVNAAFGGVRIFWNRQVSPPPGTATFADVSTSHPFFQVIEALVASGITAGCGSGNFCPDANVTRKQMAAFLAKALGLHWTAF